MTDDGVGIDEAAVPRLLRPSSAPARRPAPASAWRSRRAGARARRQPRPVPPSRRAAPRARPHPRAATRAAGAMSVLPRFAPLARSRIAGGGLLLAGRALLTLRRRWRRRRGRPARPVVVAGGARGAGESLDPARLRRRALARRARAAERPRPRRGRRLPRGRRGAAGRAAAVPSFAAGRQAGARRCARASGRSACASTRSAACRGCCASATRSTCSSPAPATTPSRRLVAERVRGAWAARGWRPDGASAGPSRCACRRRRRRDRGRRGRRAAASAARARAARVMRVALVGGDAGVRDELRAALARHRPTLATGGRGRRRRRAGRGRRTRDAEAADRCRALAAVVPCVLLRRGRRLLAGAPGRAAAPARVAVATLPPRGPTRARRASPPRARASRSARLRGGALSWPCWPAAGGQGTTTIALGLARSLGAAAWPLLDLDLAGGSLARGSASRPTRSTPGWPARSAGRRRTRGWRGRRPTAGSCPRRRAPTWPGWCATASCPASAAPPARRTACVVADVGRPLGPTAEALLAADLLLVVTRLEDDALDGGAPPAGPAGPAGDPGGARRGWSRTRVRRRDAVRLHGLAGVLGARGRRHDRGG